MTPDTTTELIESLADEAEGLCQIHDHITRVIATLEAGESFSSRGEPNKSWCRSATSYRGHLNGGGPDGS